MGPKVSAAGASGGGGLPTPADAFIREDGVITAPPGTSGGGGGFPAGLVTLTDAPTIAVDASAGSVFLVTLNGDRTLGTPSNPVAGQPILFEFIQGAGGGFTLGFSAAYAFPASIPQPALSTTAGQRDFLQFTYDALVSLWQCTGWVPDQNAGIVPVAQGGSGQDTQAAAITALTGAQTSGYYLRSDGTDAALAAIASSDLPVVSGQYLRTPTQYAPASLVNLASTGTTYSALNCTPTNVASGSSGGEISVIASWSSPSAGVLDVGSTTGYPTAGTLTVAASGSTTAIITYTGISGSSFTGCAYVSGLPTGTVATGGAVTLTSVSINTGAFTAPASGSVVVTVSCVVETSGSGDMVGLALLGLGTSTVYGYASQGQIAAANGPLQTTVPFLVTGLTPGDSYTFALASGAPAGTVTVTAYGQNTTTPGSNRGGPVVMIVQAV